MPSERFTALARWLTPERRTLLERLGKQPLRVAVRTEKNTVSGAVASQYVRRGLAERDGKTIYQTALARAVLYEHTQSKEKEEEKRMAKAAIGANPLDALVPAKAVAPPASKPERVRVEKERVTVHISSALAEEARNAVVALSGPPLRLTLAAFAEAAFRRELERIRKEHHKGKPFPKRDYNLKGGRPIGS